MSISAVEETFSYTQPFRNGSIETVMPVQASNSPVAWVGSFEDALVRDRHHQALVEAHTKLGVEGPVFVMLSFVDIGGAPLEQSNSMAAAIYGDAALVPTYYPDLTLPELFVESFVTSVADIYGPLFDMVWNAAGRPARPQRQ
ncbi:hypothetical protein L3V59_07090 [Burkholderia aenigmatica]|uniref:hypothetical protein n=1 Tax=Burkholderia aenigmatica TaxID=2015348 RepID=UPI001F3564A4|nr:hypothetical protein [Burkholderia aenigmatica]UKD12813.1 hypothetical protein L3V59_07090 [Burkholderia aenigmatica]